MGDEDPCFCACNRFFPIFRQATTSVQPGEGAPGDPSARQHFKALCGIGASDDLDGPSAEGFQRIDDKGNLLADMPHGDLITVVQNALGTIRNRQGTDPERPFRIVEYANGRLTTEYPDTGTSFERHAFGGDNEAAFRNLLKK